MNTVLLWANPPLQLPATINSALGAGGTFHGGAGFNIRIWQQVVWLTQFIEEWWASSFEERQRALRDPWAFRDLTDRVQGGWEPAMRTSLLALVWPGYFDSVVKEADRQRIRAAFAHHLGPSGTPATQTSTTTSGEFVRPSRSRAARVDWYAEPYLSAGAVSPRRASMPKGAAPGWCALAKAVRSSLTPGETTSFVSLPATNLRLELETATEASIRGAVDAGYTHLDYAQRLQLTQADQAFILRMAPDDIVLTLVQPMRRLGMSPATRLGATPTDRAYAGRSSGSLNWSRRRSCPNPCPACSTSRVTSSS